MVRPPQRTMHSRTTGLEDLMRFLHSRQCANLPSAVFLDPIDGLNRYLVGQAVGSIFFPPYSETFGRKTLYTASTLAYAVSCVIVAVVPSLGLAVIARFVGGVLSAIPTIVVAGSIEDLFDMEQRITMVFLWALIGNMGLVLGPMYSAYITYSLGWYVLDNPFVQYDKKT